MKLIFLGQSFSEVLGDVRARIFPSIPALITQLIATTILFLIIRKYLWKSVIKMIEARKDHVLKMVTEADEKLKQASEKEVLAEEALKTAYKEAWTIVDDAKVNALNQRDVIISKAELEAKNKREQATRDVEMEKTRAEKQIRIEIIDVALEAARKVVGREVSSKDNLKLVEDFVKEVDLNG